METIILVNEKDEEIGLEDKLKCHQGKGILHRAFTILVSNKKGELLLGRRSKNKLLWPFCWETACSSHPKPGEDLIESAEKRLKEELGVVCKLRYNGKFQYQTKYKNIGSENEMCWLLSGKYEGEVMPNPEEVAEHKWINIEDLKKALSQNPQKYAPWLKPALETLEHP